MSIAPIPTGRVLQVAELKDSITRLSENCSVFVAGPFIRKDQPANHPDNKASLGAELRFAISKRLEDFGHEVYLGEDTHLRAVGERHYGSHNNAVVYERHCIVSHFDAVIVFPSSPGSFCELGDWAPEPDICSKMLVCIDHRFEHEANYINDGPAKFASQNHAQLIYLDYKNHDLITEKCKEFLSEILSKKRIRGLYGKAR